MTYLVVVDSAYSSIVRGMSELLTRLSSVDNHRWRAPQHSSPSKERPGNRSK